MLYWWIHCQSTNDFSFTRPNEISVDLPCGNCGAVLDVHSLERYWDTCELVSEKLNQSQLPLDASQFCLKLMRHSRSVAHVFKVGSFIL